MGGGVIGFVTNGAWIDGTATSGFRKNIEKEFSSIYVFNLRGNARTSGEQRKKEKGNVFGEGTRTPVTITLLVKNPNEKKEKAKIYYYDIGDYLSREEKLFKIKDFKSIGSKKMDWQILNPNEEGDWINQRNDKFKDFIPLYDEIFIPNTNYTKLLGHPEVIQNPMEEECEAVTRGFDMGGVESYPKQYQKVIRSASKDWILLFQMDTIETDDYELMFGDSGHIYFWIKKEDLANKNFENIWLILQCY